MRKFLSLEDDSQDDDANMDTDQQVVEPGESTDDTAEDTPAEDDEAVDEPLELPDLDALKVSELDDLNVAASAENKEAIDTVAENGQEVLDHLDTALEHFIDCCKTKRRASLKLAQEEHTLAQSVGEMNNIDVLEVPEEAAELDDAVLSPALESIGSTISGVIKAIYALIRKALTFLSDFLRNIWRELTSLQKGIATRTAEIVSMRKRLGSESDKDDGDRIGAFAASHGVDFKKYVQVGRHKAFLCLGGKELVEGRYEVEFERLNGLLKSSPKYEAFLKELPKAFEDMLTLVKSSVTGVIPASNIDLLFQNVPDCLTLAVDMVTSAQMAHGLLPTDDTSLLISNEYIGNFYQAELRPNTVFLKTRPSIVQRYAVWGIRYTKDSSLAIEGDFLRLLKTNELKAVSTLAVEQATSLISAQRSGDQITRYLDSLSEMLKKTDGAVWQNNQGDAASAALKNQQLVTMAKAVSSIEATINRFYTTALLHIRSVQHAWFAYLNATLMRERELIKLGMKNK